MVDRPGKVVWHVTMSLDGFIADAAEEMDWVFGPHRGGERVADVIAAATGALVVGRRTMDVERRQQPGFYGGAFSGPFFVLGSEIEEEPVVGGVRGVVVAPPIHAVIDAARTAAEGRDVGVLGATTARHALEEGLVDEVVVQIVPILLGDGIPLHRGAKHPLRLVDAERDGDVVTLRLVPERSPAG